MKRTVKTFVPLALALLASSFGAVGHADAAQFTCIATVYTGPQASGFAQLGSTVVTGPTVTHAASACHEFARQRFAANPAWSDPNKVCLRYPSGAPRNVEVLDYFQEMGHSRGYNRVGGFNVTCNAARNVHPFPTVPTVVPTH